MDNKEAIEILDTQIMVANTILSEEMLYVYPRGYVENIKDRLMALELAKEIIMKEQKGE